MESSFGQVEVEVHDRINCETLDRGIVEQQQYKLVVK